jgi:predicted metal-binding protein
MKILFALVITFAMGCHSYAVHMNCYPNGYSFSEYGEKIPNYHCIETRAPQKER